MSTTADQPPVRTAPSGAAAPATTDATTATTDATTATTDATTGTATTSAPAPTTSTADRVMRRILRLPEGRTATAAEARSAFQKSLLISTCRCLLMYIVFPFVLPAVGLARGVGPWIGLVIGLLAMVSIVYSIRRFWRADHSKRWHYTIFGVVIIGFLIYLAIEDLSAIVA